VMVRPLFPLYRLLYMGFPVTVTWRAIVRSWFILSEELDLTTSDCAMEMPLPSLRVRF
jgi:hypothetical protein